jgi:hypothetical protein
VHHGEPKLSRLKLLGFCNESATSVLELVPAQIADAHSYLMVAHGNTQPSQQSELSRKRRHIQFEQGTSEIGSTGLSSYLAGGGYSITMGRVYSALEV